MNKPPQTSKRKAGRAKTKDTSSEDDSNLQIFDGSRMTSFLENSRKTILVGKEFQVVIPPNQPRYTDANPAPLDGQLIWGGADSKRLSDKQIRQYLEEACNIGNQKSSTKCSSSRSGGKHIRDDEHALTVLRECDYHIGAALERLKAEPLNTPDPQWSEEDCQNFECGMRLYGKDFFSIHSFKLPHRTVKDIIRFYYLWKKTERHDIFANRARLEKTKYIIRPGMIFHDDYEYASPFEDKSLNEIQYVVYGSPSQDKEPKEVS